MLMLAAFLGMTVVAIGATGAHALRPQFSPEQFESFMTGVRYQMYHALALLSLAVLLVVLKEVKSQFSTRLLRVVGWLWFVGTLCFSGSIYLMVLAGARFLFWLTPIGGVLLIIGWFLLFLKAARMAYGSSSPPFRT